MKTKKWQNKMHMIGTFHEST